MSIQQQLNNMAISMCKKLQATISQSSDEFCINQMRCSALKEINNTYMPIENMTQEQLDKFQDEVIEKFKYNNWI